MSFFEEKAFFEQNLNKKEGKIEHTLIKKTEIAEEEQGAQVFCVGGKEGNDDLLPSEPKKEEDAFFIDVSDLLEKKDES